MNNYVCVCVMHNGNNLEYIYGVDVYVKPG